MNQITSQLYNLLLENKSSKTTDSDPKKKLEYSSNNSENSQCGAINKTLNIHNSRPQTTSLNTDAISFTPRKTTYSYSQTHSLGQKVFNPYIPNHQNYILQQPLSFSKNHKTLNKNPKSRRKRNGRI